MKRIMMALVMALLAGQVMACPLGETPVGGTGSHHKGGTCIPK